MLRVSISENSGEPALKFSPSEATRVVTLGGDRSADGQFGDIHFALVQRGFRLLGLSCRERPLLRTGAGSCQLQRRLSRLAFADRQLQIAGGFIDDGLGCVPRAGKLGLPVESLLVEGDVGLCRCEFGPASGNGLRPGAVDAVQVGPGHAQRRPRRDQRCDKLRAFEFGDDRAPVNGVADIRAKFRDTAGYAWADVDAVAGHFTLHGERWRPCCKPKHGSERREREYSNHPSKTLEASH